MQYHYILHLWVEKSRLYIMCNAIVSRVSVQTENDTYSLDNTVSSIVSWGLVS